MSTQQILGVAGAVVGSFFGYPQLGFVVGSLVGGLITPKEKVEGPRVDDLKVQVSTLGAGIPRAYGSARVGGNVIWSTPKIEVSETREEGKGGGVEQTSYRYFVYMGIALCATPQDGSEVVIRKIWQDGKLIYDVSPGATVGATIASAENPYASFILYQGKEDQLPDPIEEGFLGIGNVPAYRGLVRVRLNTVECPGGRVPQFSFEILVQGVTTVASALYSSTPATTTSYASLGKESGMQFDNRTSSQVSRQDFYRVGPGYSSFVGGMSIRYPGQSLDLGLSPVQSSEKPMAIGYSVVSGSGSFLNQVFQAFDVEGNVVAKFENNANTNNEVIQIHWAAYDSISGGFAVSGSTNGAEISLLAQKTKTPTLATPRQPIAFYNNIVYVTGQRSGITVLDEYDGVSGAFMGSISSGIDVGVAIDGGSYRGISKLMVCANEYGIYILEGVNDAGLRPRRLWKIDGNAWRILADDIYYANGNGSGNFPETFFANDKYIVVGPCAISAGVSPYRIISLGVVATTPASVSNVIAEQCRLAGLQSGQFDVSAIDDEMYGYTLTNPASARSNIEPLLTAYGIFAVEEDGLLKFKYLADVASQGSVPYQDLGCSESGDGAGDAMPLVRAQELELPRSMSVTYTNPASDYQTATEKAIRQATISQLDQTVELPMITDADYAATVAHRMLYNMWAERNRRSLKVSRKYAIYSPGDALSIEYPRGTVQVWRIDKATDTGALCEWEVVPNDAELLAQTAVGATGYVGQEVAALPPPTRLQLLDMPILRDQDNNAGLYAAMCGFGPGWTGAELFAGDDVASLQSRGTVENQAVIGRCDTALGNWQLGIVDETNTVTVNVEQQALSSITYDQLITGTQNIAAIGTHGRWEVVKFRTASSLGAGRYLLSGFVRGRRGTEWARGTHAIGDTFVLLSLAGMLRPNFDAGSIGQVKTYKAVSKGRGASSASTQTYANTAEGLEPFAPSNLRKTQDASGNVTLQVVRRTRLSENWLRGIVPLGEEVSSFEFVLYTDNTFATVRRVIASSTRSAIYTTAMQTADGYVGGALYVRVYQLSGIVGRGRPLESTI